MSNQTTLNLKEFIYYSGSWSCDYKIGVFGAAICAGPSTKGTHDLCFCHPSLSHTDAVQSTNNVHNRLYVHL